LHHSIPQSREKQRLLASLQQKLRFWKAQFRKDIGNEGCLPAIADLT